MSAGMAGRGKLIAVIGDEDTVTGFLLGGIGELNKNRHPNFLVVEKDTTVNEIEDTFRYVSQRGLKGSLCCPGRGGAAGDPGRGASRPWPRFRPREPERSVRDPPGVEASASQIPFFFWGGGAWGGAMPGSRVATSHDRVSGKEGNMPVTDAAPGPTYPAQAALAGPSPAAGFALPRRAGSGHCKRSALGRVDP